MAIAWYMNDTDEDKRLEHHKNPKEFVPIEDLYFLTRVKLYLINADDHENDGAFVKLKVENGYNYEDICEVAENSLPNYDEKIRMFYKEHIHDDEEIRLFLDGSGYFDVRDLSDNWIRIAAKKGDLIILPAGIYHRFTPDSKNYAKVKRVFIQSPCWEAIYRPENEDDESVNERSSRKEHLTLLGKHSLMALAKEIEKDIY